MTDATPLTCPNCGHPLPEQQHKVVMTTCPSCVTTLYIDGPRLLTAGAAGELHDGPQLFGVGDVVKLGRKAWEVLGHARFSYGRGWWDEYWCEDPRGKGAWISVDEGDIIVQLPLTKGTHPALRPTSTLGQTFQWQKETFRVVETGQGTVTALRGAFGERLAVGDTFTYVNAQGDNGTLMSCEGDGTGRPNWFIGDWHDPFEVSHPPVVPS